MKSSANFRNTSSLLTQIGFVLLFFLGWQTNAIACTPWAYDLPGYCACGGSAQNWPTTSAPRQPLQIFDQLIGLTTRCTQHRGQPYWQIEKLWGSPESLHQVAEVIENYYPFLIPTTDESAWCSETVSFVHYRAGYPYPRGFASPAMNSSMLTNVTQLKTWYQLEEKMTEDGIYPGRGRWIEGSEFDATNFEPGVNGPVPGAYQLIEDYHPETGWVGASTAHSQMIESMVVFVDIEGNVLTINYTFVDGNVGSSHRFNDGTWQARARRASLNKMEEYTILGSRSFPSSTSSTVRKIRGWGIPVGENNWPEYDSDKLQYVLDVTNEYEQILEPPVLPGSPTAIVLALAEFQEETSGAISIFSSPDVVTTDGYPTDTQPWTITASDSAIEIDLGAEYPVPLLGLRTTWLAGFLPSYITANLMAEDGSTVTVQTPWDGYFPEPLFIDDPSGYVNIPLELLMPSGSAPVRSIVLHFPEQPWDTARLVGLDFILDLGVEEIAFEPELEIDTSAVPDGLVSNLLLAWDDNGTTIFYRQIKTAFRSNLSGSVTATVYDVRGRLIQSLGAVSSGPGHFALSWDGRDRSGSQTAQGVYFLHLSGQGNHLTRKFMLTR